MAIFDVFAGHSMADYDSSGGESLDEEFGIPKLQTPGVRRSTRVNYPVERLKYDSNVAHHFMYMANVVQSEESTCFNEAVGTKHWNEAMDEEMNALDDSGTWELTPLPNENKAIGCKWVYKVKHNAEGLISRYKARLVTKGYAQTYGIDFEETLSPVAKMATVRAVISMAVAKGWEFQQMDVKNVFLNGELQEEVYMENPEGYVHLEFLHYVCRLKKALYGLKQAPRAWTDRMSRFLQSIGFEISKADLSLYVKKTGCGLVIIVIYVDYLIVTRSNKDEIVHVKKVLGAEFDMKNLGELKYFLGIEMVQMPQVIWMLQRQYVLDMLKKYGMTACNHVAKPME